MDLRDVSRHLDRKWKPSYLNKGLDLGALGKLLFAHLVGDFPGIPVDASHQSMSIRLLRGTIIIVLDNDGFSASKATPKDQHDLSRFHNLTHCGCLKHNNMAK